MKVKKHGGPCQVEYHCSVCGCDFVANVIEYRSEQISEVFSNGKTFVTSIMTSVRCPDCHNICKKGREAK